MDAPYGGSQLYGLSHYCPYKVRISPSYKGRNEYYTNTSLSAVSDGL